MLKAKIKSLLVSKGLKVLDYADALNIQDQSLSRKLKDDAFTIQDILVLANLTESHLCLVANHDQKVILDFSEAN